MGEIIVSILLGAGLFLCVITDIKSKEIYLPVVVLDMAITSAVNLYTKRIEPIELAWIIAIGLFFVMVSFVSGNQIGTGDAFLFMMTGCAFGIMGNLFIIFISFMAAFIYAVYIMLIKHKSKNYRMPFAPFVFTAYVLYFI